MFVLKLFGLQNLFHSIHFRKKVLHSQNCFNCIFSFRTLIALARKFYLWCMVLKLDLIPWIDRIHLRLIICVANLIIMYISIRKTGFKLGFFKVLIVKYIPNINITEKPIITAFVILISDWFKVISIDMHLRLKFPPQNTNLRVFIGINFTLNLGLTLR